MRAATLPKKKKTKLGVDLKSLQGLSPSFSQIHWVVVLEKKRNQVFGLENRKSLKLLADFSEQDFHEAISKKTRGSAGRTQESYLVRQSPKKAAFPRHSFSREISPEQAATRELQKKTFCYLKKEFKRRTFDFVTVVGHPEAVGRFHLLLSKHIPQAVYQVFPKWNSYLNKTDRNQFLLKALRMKPKLIPRQLPSLSPNPTPKRSYS